MLEFLDALIRLLLSSGQIIRESSKETMSKMFWSTCTSCKVIRDTSSTVNTVVQSPIQVLESLRYKYTCGRVRQRERMTSSLTLFPNSVRQATSSQREKPVLQVRTKRESLPKHFTIKSSFYIINFLRIIYSSILHYIYVAKMQF